MYCLVEAQGFNVGPVLKPLELRVVDCVVRISQLACAHVENLQTLDETYLGCFLGTL